MAASDTKMSDEILIAKLTESKLKELFCASMDLFGTESIEDWDETNAEAVKSLREFSLKLVTLLGAQNLEEPVKPELTTDNKTKTEEYQRAMIVFENTPFVVYRQALIDLFINHKKEKLVAFLIANTSVADFLKANIDKLIPASESFAEFNQKKREGRVRRTKGTLLPRIIALQKQLKDLQEARDKLVAESSGVVRSPTGIEPVAIMLDARAKIESGAATVLSSEAEQSIKDSAKSSWDNAVMILSSAKLSDLLAIPEWQDLFQKQVNTIATMQDYVSKTQKDAAETTQLKQYRRDIQRFKADLVQLEKHFHVHKILNQFPATLQKQLEPFITINPNTSLKKIGLDNFFKLDLQNRRVVLKDPTADFSGGAKELNAWLITYALLSPENAQMILTSPFAKLFPAVDIVAIAYHHRSAGLTHHYLNVIRFAIDRSPDATMLVLKSGTLTKLIGDEEWEKIIRQHNSFDNTFAASVIKLEYSHIEALTIKLPILVGALQTSCPGLTALIEQGIHGLIKLVVTNPDKCKTIIENAIPELTGREQLSDYLKTELDKFKIPIKNVPPLILQYITISSADLKSAGDAKSTVAPQSTKVTSTATAANGTAAGGSACSPSPSTNQDDSQQPKTKPK